MTRAQARHTGGHRSGPAGDGVDLLILAGVGMLAVAAGGQWLIGTLAALLGRGRLPHASLIQALTSLGQLPHHLGDPRAAWPEPARATYPGPSCTGSPPSS